MQITKFENTFKFEDLLNHNDEFEDPLNHNVVFEDLLDHNYE